MPEDRAPASGLRPSQLIALNADLELPRAVVCLLARAERQWWKVEAPDDGRVLGVAGHHLARARAVLRRAASIAASERLRASGIGASIVSLHDRTYPADLLALALPPPVLYVRGTLPDRPALSIVGARQATAYGRDVATAFAGDLAARGLTIVSGFARGIDTAAHRAALAAGGTTIAVLGCGLDYDYPRGRRAERRRVAASGALLSEFPLGASPRPRNFPIRNRLIAALGLGTLVVEATVRSGSLITARLALELGRDIYAVPGRVFDSRALGPNALIRDGAFLVQHPRDVLETLSQEVLTRLEADDERGDDPPKPDLPAPQDRVLTAIGRGERPTVEDLARRTSIQVPEILAALLDLEMAGWVRRHPGPSYGRTELW